MTKERRPGSTRSAATVTDQKGKPMTTTIITDKKRAATIAGLRMLADYAESHPDAPLPRFGVEILVSVRTRKQVEQAADALDVGTRDERGTFEAVREFGGGVTLSVYTLSQERRDRYAAEMTYAGRVTP